MAGGRRSTSSAPRPVGQQQLKQLDEALRDAYNKASFERLLLFELDRELEQIASGGNFKDIVFSVIMTAKREWWLNALVRAAAEDRPDNANVQAVARQWL